MNGEITEVIKHHYRHFDATALNDAAEGCKRHLDGGGKMMITLAGWCEHDKGRIPAVTSV